MDPQPKENSMRVMTLTALTGLLLLAAPAAAGPRIVTPAMVPPITGSLWCEVVNASNKKEIVVDILVYGANGTAVCTQTGVAIGPNSSNSNLCPHDAAHHCAVTITKGGKKNAIVSVTARDVNGNILGSLPAGR
jgi:hypothetical protein